MFSLLELAPLNQHQNRFKLLKPWWEVFMDYLVVLMLVASVLACTEQLSRDQVVCIPLDPRVPANTSDHRLSASSDVLLTPARVPRVGPDLRPTARGRRTHLVFQQYAYISQVCYHKALPWGSRFFPYVALLQSLLLVASGSFWLHVPHTSACIEHFLAILAKCCESPWTSQALSHAARQENMEENPPDRRPPASLSSPLLTRTRRSSIDSGTDSPLLQRSDSVSSAVPPSPCPSTHSSDSPTSPVSLGSRVPSPSTKQSVTVDSSRQGVSLDKSDGEQARALFEKVRKFRSHCENSTIIYKVYLGQTIFKLLMVMLIVVYTIPLLSSVSFTHTCLPEEEALVGYSIFECIHVLSSLLRKLMVAYLTLLGLYGLLNLYTLSWILHSSLQHYSFRLLKELYSLRDVPDLRNDLAFLLHMLDQYDLLLARRLSVFLSPVSESRLLEESLERRWGEEQLRAVTTVNADGCSMLQLVALPRLPPALFTLSQLQVLKLELITEARFTAHVANMNSLRELHLYHCTASVDPSALGVLQERLEVLHFTFTQPSEIPSWIFSLRSLHELHLSGRLSSEGGVGRSWALGSLRQLRHLRVLVIRGMLQRVSGELCEVAGSLVRLEIYNEGTRLLVLAALKRMVDLTELLLQDCQLERLPSVLLALNNLRTLDLQHNNLRTLEELLSLAHLRHLSCLRLASNRVLAVPNSVGVLRGLEILDLSYNQIRTLPPALFTLRRLRRLLLASNLLEELPVEVKALQLLTELDLSGNRLENLPPDLFSRCLELRILNVAHNSLGSLPRGIGVLRHLCRLDLRSNSLEELPAELGYCSGLHGGGLLVEEWLFLSLPRPVRDLLSRSASPSGTYSEANNEKGTMAENDVDNELLDYEEDEEPQGAPESAAPTGKKEVKGSYVSIHSSGFRDFLLKPELLRAIIDCGFEHPSEVQHECIPQAILGMDILCQAKSGMGKTAVFVLATLQQIEPVDGQVSVLVMCHTRELAFQISKEYERFSKYMPNVKAAVFFGGLAIKKDEEVLKKNCPHIVVGTPGRILALIRNKTLSLKNVKHFVLDECDKMLEQLDMRRDVQDIFRITPHEKQVMMFSATLSKEIRPVCRKFMQDPMEVFVDDETKLTLHGLQQYYCKLKDSEKNRKLFDLLDVLEFNQVVIFVKSVQRCIALSQLLVEQNFPAIAIHRGMAQEERLSRYQQFKDFQRRILVATNLFGRGMDIERVNIVFNYDMPEDSDTYLHRVARAGRFGTKGLAITFVSDETDAKTLNDVQDRFEVNVAELPDEIDISSYIEQSR
ncbi:hypothetical protein Q5P01_017779 [Channa striata]|uniref:RNA helicase n=1 Tax=Channa striata TaxID=64152 RepID=A0AA88MAK9_CHASR|nr:hypothetical protein Q5P01_017779 [Channa striata]